MRLRRSIIWPSAIVFRFFFVRSAHELMGVYGWNLHFYRSLKMKKFKFGKRSKILRFIFHWLNQKKVIAFYVNRPYKTVVLSCQLTLQINILKIKWQHIIITKINYMNKITYFFVKYTHFRNLEFKEFFW